MRLFRHFGAMPFSVLVPSLALVLVLAGCAAPPDTRMAAADCLPGALDDLLVADRLMLGEETNVPVFSRPGRPPFMAQAMCGPGTIRMASGGPRMGRGRMASMEGRAPFLSSTGLSSPAFVAPVSLPATTAPILLPEAMEIASY